MSEGQWREPAPEWAENVMEMQRNEIASLRASVERLTKERDEFKRIGQEFERDGRTTFEQSCVNLKRAESAEATIARLAAVVRAAEEYVDSFQEEDALEAGRCYAVIVAALSSLTAEDRRRVGIEG